MRERDAEIMARMLEVDNSPKELWKVRMPGGSKFFGSFPGAARFEESLRERGVKNLSLSRVATKISETADNVTIIAEAMEKCFKVEALDTHQGIKELGSAFCIFPKYFLTCAHCIRKYDKNVSPDIEMKQMTDGIMVELKHGEQMHQAKVVAIDTIKDIALVTADIESPYFELDSSPIAVGEEILTVGSPHGFENNASTGTLGSLNRQIYNYDGAPKYMFVDLSIFSGNSGGPIIRASTGKVIGIVTLVVSDAGGYGLNAGLPVSYVEEFCRAHISGFVH
jgi:S1-C subfamily serine protease